VAGDFNGDGILDLAVTNRNGADVTILLGKGDGTFTAAPGTGALTNLTAVAIGDFNGDGIPDLAGISSLGGLSPTSGTSVFLGNGDGTFSTGPSFGGGPSYDSVNFGGCPAHS